MQSASQVTNNTAAYKGEGIGDKLWDSLPSRDIIPYLTLSIIMAYGMHHAYAIGKPPKVGWLGVPIVLGTSLVIQTAVTAALRFIC